jgi:hypothetical protein
MTTITEAERHISRALLSSNVVLLRDISDSVRAILAELDRLRDERQTLTDAVAAARVLIDRLRVALDEAIALRVTLYRHSDMEGDTDDVPDEQLAQLDPFARKWVAAARKGEA